MVYKDEGAGSLLFSPIHSERGKDNLVATSCCAWRKTECKNCWEGQIEVTSRVTVHIEASSASGVVSSAVSPAKNSQMNSLAAWRRDRDGIPPHTDWHTNTQVQINTKLEAGVFFLGGGAEVFLTPQLESHGCLCRGEGRDKVVTLWRSHPSTSVRLAVQLTLDEEVAPLLEVDVTVGADEAAGVAVLVPSLHHRPTAGHTHTQADRKCYFLITPLTVKTQTLKTDWRICTFFVVECNSNIYSN